jgi:hypothetical protein
MAERLVADNWPAIAAVAAALGDGGTLTGDAIDAGDRQRTLIC